MNDDSPVPRSRPKQPEPWIGLLPKNLTLASSACPPLDDSETTETEIQLNIHDAIKQKYNKVTTIETDDSGWPCRYCYHSDCDRSPPDSQFNSVKVDINRDVALTFEDDVRTEWLKLSQRMQDKLYVILSAAQSVWRKVRFDTGSRQWFRSAVASHDIPTSLQYYGAENTSHDLLHYLTRGRTYLEMQQYVQDAIKSHFGSQNLDESWVLALTSGMTNGDGCTAVYMLLDWISGLLAGLPSTFPKVVILHLTSSRAGDDFSIASSPLSHTKTRSSSSSACSPPDAKHQKTNGESESKHHVDDQGEKHRKRTSKTQDQQSRRETISFPCHNRRYSDMSVVAYDRSSGSVKYLILIEIHSRGKPFLEAKQMFLKEIVAALQGQNEIFGLFFSLETVIFFQASRNLEKKKISVYQRSYSMLDSRCLDLDTFCVGRFQELIMDIFSTYVHGLKYIDT